MYNRFAGNEDILDDRGNIIGWKAKHETIHYKMSRKLELIYRFLGIYYKNKASYILATYPFHNEPPFGIYFRDNYDGSIFMISKCAHKLHYTEFEYKWKFETKRQKKFAISEILRVIDAINKIQGRKQE